MQIRSEVTINKPGSDFHGMAGEIIRINESLDLFEVLMPCQQMNSETRTLTSHWGPYVVKWAGGSWIFRKNELIY